MDGVDQIGEDYQPRRTCWPSKGIPKGARKGKFKVDQSGGDRGGKKDFKGKDEAIFFHRVCL